MMLYTLLLLYESTVYAKKVAGDGDSGFADCSQDSRILKMESELGAWG